MNVAATMPADRYDALVCECLSDDRSGVGLRTLPGEPLRSGEVRVAVQAAALNFPDLLMCQGLYQHKPALPFVIGMEGAGIVIEVSAQAGAHRPGDAVYFGTRTGACATQIVLPHQAARPIPQGLDFAQAAAFQVTALTAEVALVRRGHLQAGETLLVHGASGGTGYAAVQLGVHLGATVIATGTSDTKLAQVKAAGAHHVLNLAGGLREQVKALTGGRGADVVFDPVGGDVFDETLRCINWGARVLVIGFASGRIPSLPVNLPLIKQFSIIGVRAGEYGRRDPEAGRMSQAAIEALAASGVFRPHIGARLPLSRGLDALRVLADRQVAGKVVIDISDGARPGA